MAPTREELPPFAQQHQLGKLARRQDTIDPERTHVAHEGDYDADTEMVDDAADAEVVLSLTGSAAKPSWHAKHRPVIDIDVPAALVPSSTPGHGHLYIDVEMTWAQYRRLLEVLRDVGIIESGYYDASAARQFTSVRMPSVRKQGAAVPAEVAAVTPAQ